MKKVLKFVAPFLLITASVLFSCKKNNNKEETKVLLTFGDMHATETKEIDAKKFNSLHDSKENFLFVVNSKGCTCWSKFREVLNPYISQNNLLVYRMTYDEFEKVDNKYGLTSTSEGTTTFAIFENGEYKRSINTVDNESIVYDSATFTKYMNENVIKPGCYHITLEDDASIKASNKNAIIYYGRSGCPDCNAIDSGILRTYIKNNPNANKIYIVDLQEKYETLNAEDYQTLKDDLGMSSKYNTTYGFDTGYVPFFSFIKNGTYSSGAVIYNDKVTKEGNDFIVTNSYYSSERVNLLEYTSITIKGKVIPQSELYVAGEKGYWKNDEANKYYEPILNSFLNTYLPQVNYSF